MSMDLLTQSELKYLSRQDQQFIVAFNNAMNHFGYDYGGKIEKGYCWGRHMLIYRKTDAGSKQVYARLYLRESGSVLRLYLNNLNDHRVYLEHSPDHIKDVFIGPHGDCQHCHNEKDGGCRFRKTYTLNGRVFEKCNGIVFEFPNPTVEKLLDYQALFLEFYPNRGKAIQLNKT